jgi:hypothetical protein
MADQGGKVDVVEEIKTLRREQQKQRSVLFGNGTAGLDSRVDTLDDVVLGNKRTEEKGLKTRVKDLEDDRKEDRLMLRVILGILLAMSAGLDIRHLASFIRAFFGL